MQYSSGVSITPLGENILLCLQDILSLAHILCMLKTYVMLDHLL